MFSSTCAHTPASSQAVSYTDSSSSVIWCKLKDEKDEGRGGGRAALELLDGRGTLEGRSIGLLGAKPELLERSERRTLDPADVLGFLEGLAFGATIF